MKNKNFERKRQQAKRHAKKYNPANGFNEQGNHVIHSYEEKRELGWWDDVDFMLGSQRIHVAWIHPRTHYEDLCSELAHKQKPYPYNTLKPLDKKPIYPTKGTKRQRKKAKFFEWTIPEERKNYFEELRKLENEILQSSDIVVRPYFKVEQLDWCRFVNVCLPIEVVDEATLNNMANIVRQLLARTTTLDELYPNYQYDKNDWIKEMIKMTG
ncbi:MAG: hypothetical protein Q4G13_05550 [Moraxella sp.]|nr:hypothetical protein [Moraxella sp.]